MNIQTRVWNPMSTRLSLKFSSPMRTRHRRFGFLQNQKLRSKRNEDLPAELAESDLQFLLKGAVATIALASVVKYGSLFIDLPFQPNGLISVLMVFIPTIIVALFYKSKS
eukprot:g7416.t1